MGPVCHKGTQTRIKDRGAWLLRCSTAYAPGPGMDGTTVTSSQMRALWCRDSVAAPETSHLVRKISQSPNPEKCEKSTGQGSFLIMLVNRMAFERPPAACAKLPIKVPTVLKTS